MATTPTAAGRSSGAEPSRAGFGPRDLVLLLLKVAGDCGVEERELVECRIQGIRDHVASLRAEGWPVQTWELRNRVDEVVGRRYVLERGE